MKREILFCAVLGVSMITLPCIGLGAGFAVQTGSYSADETSQSSEREVSETASETSSAAEEASEAETEETEEYDCFKILDTSTGEVITVGDREFCYGAVAAEMPITFETEALKAQCVACYTYFCMEREQSRENPDDELKGADFEADLSSGQYYLSCEALEEKWGDMYDTYFEKLQTAVDEVFGEVLTYEGELIVCAYHAISSGATEACADVFAADLPYLTSVASPYDCNAPGYKTKAVFTAEELKELFLAYDSDINFSDDPGTWLEIVSCTSSGTVTEITVGDASLTGQEVRTALSLRSAVFEVTYSDEEGFVFTVLGYGHGVGMSQYGAEYMAQQGSDYQEILTHYFTGCMIEEYSQS